MLALGVFLSQQSHEEGGRNSAFKSASVNHHETHAGGNFSYIPGDYHAPLLDLFELNSRSSLLNALRLRVKNPGAVQVLN